MASVRSLTEGDWLPLSAKVEISAGELGVTSKVFGEADGWFESYTRTANRFRVTHRLAAGPFSCAEMADRTPLEVAVQDAQRLLEYASVKGIEVSAELVSQIVGAQTLLGRQPEEADTFETQQKFWAALAKLSALTKPATTESVRHAAATIPATWATLWSRLSRGGESRQVMKSTSEVAVGQARFWALIGLLLVAIFQSYYEVGESTTAKYMEAQSIVRTNVDRVREHEAAKSKATADEATRLNREVAASRGKIEEASEQTERRVHWMKVMLFWQDWTVKDPDDPQASFEQSQRILSVLEGMLILLGAFVLPITWSFLGAALYVSRALADDIRAMAYSPDRAILHRSRYYMGMVAGFIAAKLFPASTGISEGAVSTFAVALLVGYSVEVLFALLDRLISAFSTR